MKLVDEKQMKAVQELKRLEEELCCERQNTINEIARRKSAEIKLKEKEIRKEDDLLSSAGGRKMMEKLELRIRDLEADLELEKRKSRDAVKTSRQLERNYKDVEYQYYQEKRNSERVEVVEYFVIEIQRNTKNRKLYLIKFFASLSQYLSILSRRCSPSCKIRIGCTRSWPRMQRRWQHPTLLDLEELRFI